MDNKEKLELDVVRAMELCSNLLSANYDVLNAVDLEDILRAQREVHDLAHKYIINAKRDLRHGKH